MPSLPPSLRSPYPKMPTDKFGRKNSQLPQRQDPREILSLPIAPAADTYVLLK